MNGYSRRRALVAAGSAAVGALAGCLDDPSSSDGSNGDDAANGSDDAESAFPTGALTDETVVDYPAFVDADAASVSDDERTIEYADPETTFVLEAEFEGEAATDDRLRVSRDLSGETMAAFLAPERAGDAFAFHLFANEAFIEGGDWDAVAVDGDDRVTERHLAFDDARDGVSHRVIAPDVDAIGVAVVDGGREAIETDGDDGTFVGIAPENASRTETARPAAAFDIDHGSDATDPVVIVVTSGDALVGESLVVTVDGERIENPFGAESVRAGDVATIEDVSDGAELALVYETDDRDVVLESTEIRR